MMKWLFRLILPPALLMWSCNSPSGPKESTPTTGSIRIACDEMLEGIVAQEEQIFERNYPHAEIRADYMPESGLFRHFLEDSAEVIIAGRGLRPQEKAYLDSKKNLHPREFPFALSAVALVAGRNSKDTLLPYDRLISILKGESGPSTGALVIENAKSGIPAYLMDLAGTDRLPAWCYAQDNVRDILAYVNGHPGSLGIIDWTYLSDSDDPQARELLGQVSLVALENPADSLKGNFYKPYQYNLQDRLYPLTRTLTFISRTGKSDLGLGFASFITGETGQKILLKAGLLPLYQTDRWIELRPTGDLKVVR